MTKERTPAEGQLYTSPDGEPMIFVREEGGDFVFALRRDRTLFTRRHPTGEPLPPELELVHDPEATSRADRIAEELRERTAERDAVAEALRRAVAVVPVEVATDLRRVYTDTLQRLYGGRS